MALFIFLLSVIVLILAYQFIVRRIAPRFITPTDTHSTPSRRYMDGYDFIPSRSSVLTSYQFKAITLDPVIGPVIALQFGWLPALLWLLVGSIFVGWIQDYLIVMLSMRNRGSTAGSLIEILISPRSRTLFLVLIYLYLLILLGQFGTLLSTLMERTAVGPVIIWLFLASWIAGHVIYRWRVNPSISPVLALLIFLAGVWISFSLPVETLFLDINQTIAGQIGLIFQRPFSYGELLPVTFFWMIVILGACYLGAVLPVWKLSIPINSLAAWTVILSVLLAALGWAVGGTRGSLNLNFEIPALVTAYQPDVGPIWPFLFLLVSSGAVSGWRILVAAHTTSHLVERESQALPVTTKAVFGETILVALVILLASAFGVSRGLYDPNQGFKLIAGPGSVFAAGIGMTFQAIGFSPRVAGSFGAVLLALMLVTVMVLAFRFSKDVAKQMLGSRISALKNPHVGALMAVVLTLLSIVLGVWQWLWALFVGLNQLLAGIALLMVSIWLSGQGKNPRWITWASIFLFFSSFVALGYTSFVVSVYRNILIPEVVELGVLLGNLITTVFGAVFMIIGALIFIEGLSIIRKVRSKQV